MKQIKIFEIPIYTISQKDFEKKYESYKQKQIQNLISLGHKLSRAEEIVFQTNYPQNVWEFNQIIGYITISISASDIWFDIYLAKDKKFYVSSKTKRYIIDMNSIGTHFRVEKMDTNETILTQINDMISMIKRDFLYNKYFVNLTAFNIISKFIDFKLLMNDIREV